MRWTRATRSPPCVSPRSAELWSAVAGHGPPPIAVIKITVPDGRPPVPSTSWAPASSVARGSVSAPAARRAAVVLACLVAVGVHERVTSIPLTIAVGIGVSSLLALATDLVALRPLRGRSDPLSPVMATIGLALILRNVAERTQGVEDRGFPGL